MRYTDGIPSVESQPNDDVYESHPGFGEVMVMDIVVALYELNVGDQTDFEHSVWSAVDLAAQLSSNVTNVTIMGTMPIFPREDKQVLAFVVILVTAGGAFCLHAIFKIVSHAPAKTWFWRCKEVVMLTMQIYALYCEVDLYVLYRSGQGLMFDPEQFVMVWLAILPIIGLLTFMLKCYISVNFRRIWDEHDIYRLHPTNMILQICELVFHEVPELILVYFYQTRYKLKLHTVCNTRI